MDLQCPTCNGTHFHEKKIDRYSDVLYRRLACCDCGCEFVSEYRLAGVVAGSVRTGEILPYLKNGSSIGAQMVRQMFASIERIER